MLGFPGDAPPGAEPEPEPMSVMMPAQVPPGQQPAPTPPSSNGANGRAKVVF